MIATWQRIMTGQIGWTPRQFWGATLQEAHQASEGKLGHFTDRASALAEAQARNARLEAQFREKQERARRKHGAG